VLPAAAHLTAPRPSGVGYGICERLLEQLSYARPPDATPQLRAVLDAAALADVPTPPPADGLTLVLACRSLGRADAARTTLLRGLDAALAARGPDAHAQRFRANLRIELQYVDMAAMRSVFDAAAELCRKCVRPPPTRAGLPS
jgi:3-keto steroid reductase